MLQLKHKWDVISIHARVYISNHTPLPNVYVITTYPIINAGLATKICSWIFNYKIFQWFVKKSTEQMHGTKCFMCFYYEANIKVMIMNIQLSLLKIWRKRNPFYFQIYIYISHEDLDKRNISIHHDSLFIEENFESWHTCIFLNMQRCCNKLQNKTSSQKLRLFTILSMCLLDRKYDCFVVNRLDYALHKHTCNTRIQYFL